MLLRLTKTQVRRLKSDVLKALAKNRLSTETLRINCLEELTRRSAAPDRPSSILPKRQMPSRLVTPAAESIV
jgi:hypothetical protein